MDTVALKARVNEDLSALFIPPYPAISFRHPAYADSDDDILFKLPRLDQTERGATGVHHHTALRACQIIANNAFHGYLATDRDGQHAVTAAPDGILTEDSYWFIVERRDGDSDVEQRLGRDVYPIVPSFEDWQFPHDDFPSLGWDDTDADADAGAGPTAPPSASPPIATFAVPRTKFSRCILSNRGYSVTKAHLVPSANIQWFLINRMKRYEDEQHTMRFIHNTHNILTICADLHTMWDAHVFTIVPKRGRFVAHVLAASTPAGREFADEWHNTPVQVGALEGAAKQYMFTKFAQAIFMLLKPFIAFTPMRKYVARLRAKTSDIDEYEVQREWLSATALRDLYSGGGSRKASESSSSRKRSRSQTSANGDEEDEWEWPPQKTARVDPWAEASEEDEWEWPPPQKMALVDPWAEDPWAEASDEDEYSCCYTGYTGLAGPVEEEEEEERGRPRRRRQRNSRGDHTVDTLPSLTDTSEADAEETYEGGNSWPAKSHPPVLPRLPDDRHDKGVSPHKGLTSEG